MNQHPITKYATLLLFFSIALAFLAMSMFFVLPKTFLSPMIPYTLLIACGITLASYVWIYYAKQKRSERIVQQLMLNKMAKLVAYLIGFIVLFFVNRGETVPFAVQYLAIYVIYMVYDTIALNKLTKKTTNE